MSLAFYLYTIAIMLLCVMTSSTALSAYMVSHRRIFIFSTCAFLCYFFDIAIIFQSEFLLQNTEFARSAYYSIANPVARVVTGAGFIFSIWMAVCNFFDEKRVFLIAAPLFVFLTMSLSIVIIFPNGPEQQFLYFTCRQLFLLWIIAFAAWKRTQIGNEVERIRVNRFRWLWIASLILTLAILAEDTLMILILGADAVIWIKDVPLFLSGRNFSTNVLVIVLAIASLRMAHETLSLRFEVPPKETREQVSRRINDQLPAYVERHGLTARESDILRLVLAGKDNQNIASELQLALGTIKAHVHNILKKTGQATREDLIRDFWRE